MNDRSMNFRMRRAVVRCLILCATSALAGTAHAQETAGANPAPVSAPDAAAAGDIVVTALKRSDSLQKTAAAVSVISGDEIVSRQMTDIRTLGTFVPSVKTNVDRTATQFFVRGVGKQVDQARIPESVGLVVDGVNIAQYASGLALFDVRAIEVLPGPQGTLYGSSSIGGVVNISTNRPTSKAETSLLLEAGNYGTVHATAIQNVPLTDNLRVRFAYNGFYHDGYNSNGTFNDNMTAFRLTGTYTPSSDVSIFLSVTHAFDKFKPAPTVPFPYTNGKPYRIPANDPDTAFFYPPNGLPLNIGRIDQRITTIASAIDWNLGGVTLSYIGGLVHHAQPGQQAIAVAGFRQEYETNFTTFNNELRISNSGSAHFRWQAGLYQFHSTNHEAFVFGPFLAGHDDTVRTATYAAYGQLTYAVAEGMRLTGGLRVSRDSISDQDGKVFFPTGAPPNFGKGVIDFTYRNAWKRLNWKAGAEHDIGSHSMIYANVQSGFNPGTFDGNAPDPARTVNPQKMIGYAAGIKNRFPSAGITLNLEGYYYDYRDQIITGQDLATGFTALLNAPKSRIYGLQLDASWDITSNTRLRANAGYLNAKFTDFVAGSATGPLDYKGNHLTYAPELTANVGLSHVFDLGNSGSLEARVDSYLSSSYWFSYDNIPGFKQRGYTKTDASITYKPSSERWELGVWAKNLEGDGIVSSAGVVPGRSYPGVVYVDPPRTYGARLMIKLGS